MSLDPQVPSHLHCPDALAPSLLLTELFLTFKILGLSAQEQAQVLLLRAWKQGHG